MLNESGLYYSMFFNYSPSLNNQSGQHYLQLSISWIVLVDAALDGVLIVAFYSYSWHPFMVLYAGGPVTDFPSF